MSRRKPSYLSLTDMFCGAGGASIGAEKAGLKLALAINHWQPAIDTHNLNFPHAAHDRRDVSETHPSRYGSTHLLWASPECPTWSQARGKRRNFTGQLGLSEEFEPLPTEAEEKSRVTMWDVVRYAEYHDYEAVVVENVVDLMPWHLLPMWLASMATLGYAYRPLFLNSMFFGVPQSRDRVYFVFWKKANKAPDLDFRPQSWCLRCEEIVEAVQIWKNPAKQDALTISRYRAQYIYLCPRCSKEAFPYVIPALAAIDLSIKGQRIGDRKKPLALATSARIQAGIDRYWRPVIMDTLRSSKFRDPEVSPLPTQTGRQSLALATPPLLAHLRGTHANAIETSTRRADQPMGTVSGGGIHHGLVEGPDPLVIRHYTARGDEGQMSHPISSHTLGTITGSDHHSVLQPPLVVGYYGREHTARPIGLPLSTITGDPRHALIVPTDQQRKGPKLRSRTAEEPLRTQTTGQNDILLTPPLLAKAAGATYDPGTYKRIRRADTDPLWTQSATAEAALVESPDAFLAAYYGKGGATSIEEPIGTLSSRHHHALVAGDDEIDIEDCYFRMLLDPEIGLGMAFPDQTAYPLVGNQRIRVRLYGQAVTPPVPGWIWPRIMETLR